MVTVIIPTHNRPLLLLLALQSINDQIVKPHEVIVINDGSDKETIRMVENFKADGFRLKIENTTESKGACYARNLGVSRSESDILMFLDDDDTWEPNKIKDQLKVFNENPQVGLVYSGKLVVNDTDRSHVVRRIPAIVEGDLYPKILEDNYIGTTSSVALKKDIFERAGGFDRNLPAMQDYDLWIRCCQLTKVAHDQAFNVRYTITEKPENQISGKSDNHKSAVRYLLQKYEDELKKYGIKINLKFKSSRFLHLSKAVHRTNYLYSLKYSLKSLRYFPNMKAIALMFPPMILSVLSSYSGYHVIDRSNKKLKK